MIPKIIHYCWFGGKPKPKLAEKCIKSWKKFCPDYEIVEWNEENFSIAEAPLYVRQAHEAQKWAFVTDYVRLWAMTKYGGIYMDTDVEVVKPLDRFLEHSAFSGFEDTTRIPTGIMACEKDFPLFKALLEFYDTASFLNPDGTMNLTTNVTTITNLCLERGFVPNNSFQVVDGFALYPKDVFCPVSYETGTLEKTENTCTIHWFSGSWHTEEERKKKKQYNRQLRVEKALFWVSRLPNKVGMAVFGEKRYVKIRAFLKGHD